ncbi:ADAM 12 protein [Actinoplanes sp. RD1]|uniref:ADAM 12 protein n=1 Tax=Actinoplanes sp. RD1 TaxID=3064538 RepID=UPI0027405017|nr:ADAM 12 protein [Actinoplanes sp. RD1]
MSPAVAPSRLFTQAARDGRTGALLVGGAPGGTVYLVEGAVTYAESAAAPGVGELLTVSGRLAARTWEAALDAGAGRGAVGHLLLAQGHLTQGELELCVLGAAYDAAYFALCRPDAPAEFRDDVRHWLGDVVRIDPGALTRESRRRAKLVEEVFPDSRLDTAPVIPVTRAPRERISLAAAQWELLVHADGQRTPADLAQLLGRAGYATVLELRRMAALGLIEAPPPATQDNPDFVRLPRAHGEAVDRVRPAVPPASEAPTVPIVTVPSSGAPPPVPAPAAEVAAAAAAEPAPAPAAVAVVPAQVTPETRPPRLARRKPGARLPKEIAAEPPEPHPGADEVLLKRIRTALRALR